MDEGKFHSLQELVMEKNPEPIANSEFRPCKENGEIKESINPTDYKELSQETIDKEDIREGYGFLKVHLQFRVNERIHSI